MKNKISFQIFIIGNDENMWHAKPKNLNRKHNKFAKSNIQSLNLGIQNPQCESELHSHTSNIAFH